MVGGEDGDSISIASSLLKRHSHTIKRRNIKTMRDFKLDGQVDDCDIKVVILNLGSDVNIPHKNPWEMLEKEGYFILQYSCSWLINITYL